MGRHNSYNKPEYIAKLKEARKIYDTQEYRNKMSVSKIKQSSEPEYRERMRQIKISSNLVGNKAANWKGGITKNYKGYILEYSENHPYRNKQNYVYQHRLVMEAHIGRILLPTEIVHHVNRITTDNRIENLMLFANHSEHLHYHKLIRGKTNGKKIT